MSRKSRLTRAVETQRETLLRAERQLGRPRVVDGKGLELRADVANGAGPFPTGGMFGGSGYAQHGASYAKKSMAGWWPWQGTPDSDIVRNLPTLRARSYDAFMSMPVARACVRTLKTNVVGTGIRPMPLPDAKELEITPKEAVDLGIAILREFSVLAESPFFDFEGRQNFYAKQGNVFETMLLAGDALATLPFSRHPIFPYDLRLRTLEPHRLCNPPMGDYPEGSDVFGGVELNPAGELSAYWVCNRHPLAVGQLPDPVQGTWNRLPAYVEKPFRRNVLLVMEPERCEQRRGVPLLAPCLEILKQKHRFLEAELARAVISSYFAVFVKSPMPTGDILSMMSGDQQRELAKWFPYDIQLGPGSISFLKTGDDITFANPQINAPEALELIKGMCMLIGASAEIPAEILLKSFGQSFSASRAAFLEFWKRVRVWRQVLIDQLCQPVYEEGLGEIILANKIPGLNAVKYFTDYRYRRAVSNCMWTGVGQGSLDPVKDIEAAMKRVQLGVSTIQRESAEWNGSNWTDNVVQQGTEREVFELHELQYLAFPALSGPVGSPDAGKPGKPVPTEREEENQDEPQPVGEPAHA